LDLFFSYFKKIVGLHARKKAERFALKGFYIPGAFYLSAIKHILFLTGLLSLLTPVWVQAHTGALAFGYPLAGITIDGDLSDWPAALPRYPIAVPENSATVPDSSDFYASFRVGFNPQESLLYLAVEVQDQSTVADTTGGRNVWAMDGCVVGLDLGHAAEIQHFFFMEHGGIQQVRGPEGRPVPLESLHMVVKRYGTRHVYEWQIDVGKLDQEQVVLQPGTALGLNLQLGDVDEGESDQEPRFINWVIPTSSWRAGDLLLMAEPEASGRLEGRVVWADAAEGAAMGRITVDTKQAQLLVRADDNGAYALDLPAGSYQLKAGYRRAYTEALEIDIAAGHTVKVQDLVMPVPTMGVTTKAGPGSITPAGPGIRKGQWHSYGELDGLHSANISRIYQDHQGNLWFGSYNSGVGRYDGEEVLWLTTADGLVNDRIWCMLQDRQGDMWFGSKSYNSSGTGVSRYDGETFTTFTAEDGLVDNSIHDMLEDRQGHLWFATNRGVSRYAGETFTNYGPAQGLPALPTRDLLEDRQGHVWAATDGGAYRYDGERFIAFTVKDSLVTDPVYAMLEDRQGHLWFGHRKAMSRYDGNSITRFTTTDDERSFEAVNGLAEDADGHVWFTGYMRIGRYDGESITTFTSEDGLGSDFNMSLYTDRDGRCGLGLYRVAVSVATRATDFNTLPRRTDCRQTPYFRPSRPKREICSLVQSMA